MQKINFIPPIVFEILKFKNPAIWLGECIFTCYSRARFFAEMRFNKIIKIIMVHDLNPKNIYISGLFFFFFFAKFKKTYFESVFGIIPKINFFPKNPAPADFYPLGTLTLWEVSEKSYEPFWRKRVWVLTYQYTDSGKTIGPLFA